MRWPSSSRLAATVCFRFSCPTPPPGWPSSRPGAGSDHDLLAAIEDLLPSERGRWRHEHGSPGHGRDHVLPAFVSPSVTIPVLGGRLALGTWQSVVLVDTNIDNPTRTVRLSFLEG